MDPIFMHFVQEAEEEEQRDLLKLQRRTLRDNSNVFELPDTEFKKRYRLSKDLVQHPLQEITPQLQVGQRNTKIPILWRVMASLRFFAQGSYQKSVGNEIDVSMAQQTFSKVLTEVCTAIEAIAHHWIKFPTTAEQKNNIKMGFMETFRFPGTIGCIDGTHIAIAAPSEDEHLYFNRKRYHSKNVQIICDSLLNILNVNARYGGSSHDAYIWRNSAIKQHLEETYRAGDVDSWLIGDSGYPQEPWLMTPIRGAAPDFPEERYSAALASARNCVERCIGVLKGRFRCILKERVLKYHPIKAGQIINALCVLHNMCIRAHLPEDDLEPLNEDIIYDARDPNNFGDPNILALGQHRQRQLIDMYFT